MKGQLVWMTEPMKFEIREYDLPKVEPEAVLLEVLQTNVCGSDLHIAKGHMPHLCTGGIGHEMIGRVIEMGDRRQTDSAGNPLKVGDRVVPCYLVTCNNCTFCLKGLYSRCVNARKYHLQKQEVVPHFHGATYATHYYVHHDQYFYKVPDNVTNAEASSANCALSQVYCAIDKANVKPGDTVLIQGAGGLGLNACAVAKEWGATVIIVDGVASRLEMAKRFGADHTINLSDPETDTFDKVVARVKELTNGLGADVGIEVAGIPVAFAQGPHLLRVGAKYIVMGNISIGNKVEVDPAFIVYQCIEIIGVAGYEPTYLYKALQFLERNVSKYPFNELIDATFSLEEVPTAIEKSINREVTRASIIVKA
jgi:D-arabinose 1-dehydrogenase-like Zn-dependent alcohol dehydrogenase